MGGTFLREPLGDTAPHLRRGRESVEADGAVRCRVSRDRAPLG